MLNGTQCFSSLFKAQTLLSQSLSLPHTHNHTHKSEIHSYGFLSIYLWYLSIYLILKCKKLQLSDMECCLFFQSIKKKWSKLWRRKINLLFMIIFIDDTISDKIRDKNKWEKTKGRRRKVSRSGALSSVQLTQPWVIEKKLTCHLQSVLRSIFF